MFGLEKIPELIKTLNQYRAELQEHDKFVVDALKSFKQQLEDSEKRIIDKVIKEVNLEGDWIEGQVTKEIQEVKTRLTAGRKRDIKLNKKVNNTFVKRGQ